MNVWHALVIVTLVLLLLDIFRGDWLGRRLDRLERHTYAKRWRP